MVSRSTSANGCKNTITFFMAIDQDSPIFHLSPDVPGGHPHLMVEVEEQSDVFSYQASAPLQVTRRDSVLGLPLPLPRLERALTLPPPIAVAHSPKGLERGITVSGYPTIEDENSGSPESPSPQFDVALGPRLPPAPADLSFPDRNRTRFTFPSAFYDPLADYMEERLIRFRPSDSQNNANMSLDCRHPYQTQEEQVPQNLPSPEPTNQQGPWRNGNLQRISPIPENSPPPNNNSSSSFLPRGRLSVFLAEPSSPPMVYTPRAETFAEAKGEISDDLAGRVNGVAWCCCGM